MLDSLFRALLPKPTGDRQDDETAQWVSTSERQIRTWILHTVLITCRQVSDFMTTIPKIKSPPSLFLWHNTCDFCYVNVVVLRKLVTWHVGLVSTTCTLQGFSIVFSTLDVQRNKFTQGTYIKVSLTSLDGCKSTQCDQGGKDEVHSSWHSVWK